MSREDSLQRPEPCLPRASDEEYSDTHHENPSHHLNVSTVAAQPIERSSSSVNAQSQENERDAQSEGVHD